jgi:hypothetical protein
MIKCIFPKKKRSKTVWAINSLKKGVISLNPHELSRLLQTPIRSSKALTLVYQTRICFQFPHSVRVFREILTDQGINYPFIPHSKTTSFWTLKLHRFGLQNDVVLTILSLIFFLKKKEKKKEKGKYLKKKKKKRWGRNRGVAGQKWGGRPPQRNPSVPLLDSSISV